MKVMKNLLLTKERIRKTERFNAAQLDATQMEYLFLVGVLLLKKKKQLVKKLQQWILNSELNLCQSISLRPI
tara:strand:- start:643 stop:858 length:216 start_codon:yes stop_codon:yes gene_type:complete